MHRRGRRTTARRCPGRASLRHRGGDRRQRSIDAGFTLIELLIVVMVLPLVVGAIAVALLAVFKLQTGVSDRISASGDAQVVSATFVADVESASAITTEATALCGTAGSQVLGLSWSSPAAGQILVSYVEVPRGSTNSLFRRACQNGNATTPVSNVVVSHDVPANQAVAVTCASTVTNCTYASGMIGTAGISSVILVVTQPASGYRYSVSAVPRTWSAQSGGQAGGGQPLLPLELLGGGVSCPNTVLSITGGSQLTVGGSTGTVGVASACPGSIQVTGGSRLLAGAVVTADPTLQAVYVEPGSSGAATESNGSVTDPFASLTPPTNPATALTGACTGVNTSAMTCASGEYASLPTPVGGATVTFTGSAMAPGIFVFDAPVTIANGNNPTFGNGTYWFKRGLTLGGGAAAAFGNGTYIFGTPTNTAGIALDFQGGSSITSGSGGVLFYAEGGAVEFDGGATSSLTPSPQYGGVTVWDAGAIGTTNPLRLSNGSAVSLSLGGIYAPAGQIVLIGGGTMTTTFAIANSASLSGGTKLTTG